jgi:hypothetical protein
MTASRSTRRPGLCARAQVKTVSFGSTIETERHRSRTCLASGYDAVLVLKIGGVRAVWLQKRPHGVASVRLRPVRNAQVGRRFGRRFAAANLAGRWRPRARQRCSSRRHARRVHGENEQRRRESGTGARLALDCFATALMTLRLLERRRPTQQRRGERSRGCKAGARGLERGIFGISKSATAKSRTSGIWTAVPLNATRPTTVVRSRACGRSAA